MRGRSSCDLAGTDDLLPHLAGVRVEQIDCHNELVQITSPSSRREGRAAGAVQCRPACTATMYGPWPTRPWPAAE